MDKKHCEGCRDDFYNKQGGCWMLSDAKLVMKKEVHVDQRPPWNQKAIKLPSCYHRQRHVYVDPERTF